MRKLHYILLSGALLLMAACQREARPADAETFEAGFQVSVGATKAFPGDGEHATRLYVFVFDANGNRLSSMEPAALDRTGDSWKPAVPLLKGSAYTIAFWAQNPSATSEGFFSFQGNLVKTCPQPVEKAGTNDGCDAFWGTVNIAADGSYTPAVQLSRPFAQLNMLIPADFSGVTDNFQFTCSLPEAAAFPDSFDLRTGEVSSTNGWTTLKSGDINHEEFLNKSVSVGNKDYKCLASFYVLCDEDLTVTLEIKRGFTDNDLLVPDVPVRRNYQTNIIGVFNN